MKTFNQFLEEAVKPGFYGSAKTDKATMEVIKEFQTKFKKLGWKSKKESHSDTTVYQFTDPVEKKHYVDLTVAVKPKVDGAYVVSVRHENSVLAYDSVKWGVDEDGDYTERSEKTQLSMCASLLKWIKRFEG